MNQKYNMPFGTLYVPQEKSTAEKRTALEDLMQDALAVHDYKVAENVLAKLAALEE